MTTQVEFFLKAREDCDVNWMEQFLRGRDWILARDILGIIGQPATEDGKRWLRGLAEQSDKIVSGQKGYCLIDAATLDEIAHSGENLICQGKKLISRGIALRHAAHRRIANTKKTI